MLSDWCRTRTHLLGITVARPKIMEAWEKRGANRQNLWVEFRGAGHGRGPRQQNHPLSCLSEQEQPIREGGGNNYNWTIYKWPHTDVCITFILMHGTITILNHIKNCMAVLWGFDGKRDLTVCFFPTASTWCLSMTVKIMDRICSVKREPTRGNLKWQRFNQNMVYSWPMFCLLRTLWLRKAFPAPPLAPILPIWPNRFWLHLLRRYVHDTMLSIFSTVIGLCSLEADEVLMKRSIINIHIASTRP